MAAPLPTNPFTLAALKSEIQNDPATLGYGPLLASGSDAGLAALINTVGTSPVYRNDIAIKDFIDAIAPADFSALTQLQMTQLQVLFTGRSLLDASDTNLRTNIVNIFASASTATKSALSAMSTRAGTRAEVLWGTGTVVTASQVAQAFGRAG